MKKYNLNACKATIAVITFTSYLLFNSVKAQTYSNQLYFGSVSQDKISLYGDRIGATNMYGFGVGSSTLYNKSSSNYGFVIGQNIYSTDGAQGILDKSTLWFDKDDLLFQGDDVRLTLRDNSGHSTNAATIKLLESGSSEYGGFLRYNGSSNYLSLGVADAGTYYHELVIERTTRDIGIGTTNPTTKLHVVGDDNDGSNATLKVVSGTQTLLMDGNEIDALSPLYINGNSDNNILLCKENGNGNVGIGTNSPNYKLDVKGTIRAEEVIVDVGWSDFVFEKDYKLKSLEEVESFITENGHLPEIPSAIEIEKNGANLGEVESKLLMKIEELTLYIIEQDKRIKELESKSDKE